MPSITRTLRVLRRAQAELTGREVYELLKLDKAGKQPQPSTVARNLEELRLTSEVSVHYQDGDTEPRWRFERELPHDEHVRRLIAAKRRSRAKFGPADNQPG